MTDEGQAKGESQPAPPPGDARPINVVEVQRGSGLATVHASIRSVLPLFVWVVVLVLLLRHLGAVQFVVLAFLSAAILSALLRPLAERVPGPAGLGAALATLALLVVVGGLVGLVVWGLSGPVHRYVSNWPQLQQQIDQFLAQSARRLGLAREPTILELLDQAARLLTGESTGAWVGKVLDALAGAVLAGIIVIIGAAYLVAERRLAKPALKLLPPERQTGTYRLIHRLGPQFRWWLMGQVFSMAVIGVTSGLGYLIIGLPFALPLGVVAGLFEMIPTFGPAITLILAMLVAATVSTGKVVGVLVVYVVVQTLESYLLTPLVMRKAVDIPPVITLLTVVLWGNVFGPAGLILAVPIDLVIWALLSEYVIRPHDEQQAAQRNHAGPAS